MKLTALPSLAIFTALASHVVAGPLKEAKINQIVNDVKVVEPRQGARAAALQDVVKDDLGVATGVQSRAELLFQDNTLTRLGAETFFSFQPGTRDLNLERGSMLLQVPKNLGGARIRAASVTASITGTTIMMENLPGSAVKIVVLEGSLNVAVAGRSTEHVELRAGKMMIVPPEAKTLPTPVDVDLRKVVRTSALIDPTAFRGSSKAVIAALPSMPLIEQEMTAQERRLKIEGMTAANLTISGEGAITAADSEKKFATSDREASPKGASPDATATQAERETAVAILKDGEPAPVTASVATPGRSTNGSANDLAVATDFLVAGDFAINAPQGTAAGGAGTAATGTQNFANRTAVTNTATTTSGTATTTTGTGTTTTGTGTTTTGTGTTTTGTGTTTTGTGTTTTGTGTTTTGTGTTTTGTGTTTTGTGTTTTPPSIIPPAYITIPSPYIIDNTTTITTAGTTITTNGVTKAGGLYQSAAINGPASAYLFDTPSAFDVATGIDASFSVKNGGTAPSGGVAVYRFTGLEIKNKPTFATTGGPIDIALVAQTGITSTSSGSAWKVDGLRSLFLGTENGPITLGTEISTAPLGSTFQYLQVRARGSAGAVTLNNKISLTFASLYVDAEKGITASSSSAINALAVAFNTPGDIVIDKTPLTFSLKLTAGTGIKFTSPLTFGTTEMTAPLLQTSANLSSFGGFLNIGAGGIQAGGTTLSGFEHIAAAGNVAAGSVSVNNALNIGGTFTTGATTGAATLSADTVAIGGGVNLTAATSTGAGGTLTVNAADVNVSATGINGIKADGKDGLLGLALGGNGGTVNLGTTAKPIANSINVDAPISASTGANATGLLTGGNGGTVNLVASGTVTVNSSVKVSESAAGRASKKGGNITIDSRKTTGTAIAVNNSGQLLALLNAAATGGGGTIKFTSAGGDILVNGGTVQADKGTVDIRNTGAGNIALTNANIRGDVVKVGALGANGQLVIGGGTISADTSLKLYGGTTNGKVRFTDNVTLGGGGTKAIAGKTVTIDNNKTVTVAGPAAKVYTDNANYTGSGGNGTTSGKFGGAGATTQTFNKKPVF